ncbi:MAG TPA: hypothetical protein PLD84_00785 [Chitinophagales bacterium]|nr:hypothetical protein [Chitinophagales bacterium]
MKLNRFLLAICTFFFICSCGKEEVTDVVTHVHNATIKVNVNVAQGGINGQYTYTPVSGAMAELYKTAYDRSNSTDLVLSRNTDSSGLAVFYNLEEAYYFLRISHPSYGTALDETSTPDGSVSFVQIDF